jgi:hypothetical protein
MAEHGDVKIEENMGVRRKQVEEKRMRCCRVDLWPDQAKTLADAVNVGVYGQNRLAKTKQQHQ